MRAMILICAILATISCYQTTAVKLPIPDQPNYPKLTAEEVKATACLPEPVRRKLILRDKLKSDHIVELEDIIRATQ